MALFAFEELTFRYPEAPRDALRDVSVAIEPGQFVLVCGQSGCGKTTLLRQFKSALAPHGHQSGRVLFDGVPFADVPEREQVARIGFVMQNPDAQIVTDKVWHELAFVLESLGCDERTMRLRVAEMASYFGIQHWFHKNVGELSGGQKRRVAIAGVLAMNPKVLILDEPTAGLDPKGRDRILGQIQEYQQDQKNTVLIVSHSMEDVAKFAKKVLVMNQSKVFMYDDTEKVFEHASEIEQMGLAVPQVTKIFMRLADMGYPVDPHTYTIQAAKQQVLRLFEEQEAKQKKGGM